MKFICYIFSILLLFGIPNCSLFAQSASDDNLKIFSAYEEVLEHAELKMRETLEELSYNSKLHPAHTDRQTGKWVKEYLGRERWTSGFFAGSMWYLYKLTADPFWKEHAIQWTRDLESEAYKTSDHDTGFRIFNSFGNAYKIKEGRYYLKTTLQGAATLAKRFNPEIGAIKSWDWVGNYPVIIDNLMNLELLFWSADVAGRDEWYEIARTHAETSLEHHLREDGSTYHVVDFADSGAVNWKDTFQGYGAESVWTRGQSWAIYGFTMIYRFTGEKKFLDAAQSSAAYFIENLPEDFVPPYDFLEPEPSVRTKDASAAAITASGLFELYTFTNNKEYFNTAVKILLSLSSKPYLTKNSDISSILNKSTLHRGQGNLGTSYADYYFLEAIVRYRELTNARFPDIEKEALFFLDQNYPNPFNNSTVIYYSIEEEGEVDLSVYNLTGRKVQTLVNRFRSPGTYRTNFNASGLSSGVYLYRLKANGQASTKKMIVVE
ncbi:MAG: T9SS type A sorting domain-containing protein [Balneolaceae bacterium]|nr:T9SS type A sorting domain-containing protein [Balneolaceae bacterium]